jgi:hypothetical protein
MASGRLATVDITNASTDTQLYACPNNKVASFSVSIVNRSNSNNALIRLALTSGTSMTNDSYVAYDVVLYPNEVYERSGFVLSQGQYVYVRSSTTSVNAVAYGHEE